METINGWNIFSMDDMIGRRSMMSCAIGKNTMMSCAVGIDDLESAFAPAVKMNALSPFNCPCCGGNSYSIKDGSTVCDFCGTMFTNEIQSGNRNIERPDPLPTTTTR